MPIAMIKGGARAFLALAVLTSIAACHVAAEEPSASSAQALIGGKCGAGYDEPVVGGRCVYAPTNLDTQNGKALPVFKGTANAAETELTCEVAFPAESAAVCTAKSESFDFDPISEALCKDAYVPPIYGGGTGRAIVNCPKTIEVKLAGRIFSFTTKIEKGSFVSDPPLTPDQVAKLLAKTCEDRYTNEKLADGRVGRALALCESLGNDLELTVGTPRCLDEGPVTTPFLLPCGEEAKKEVITATCCVAKGTPPPPIPQEMPLPPIVQNDVKKVSQAYEEPAPPPAEAPPAPKLTAADCAAKPTNATCTACCNEVFPNQAPGWAECVTPCISKPSF